MANLIDMLDIEIKGLRALIAGREAVPYKRCAKNKRHKWDNRQRCEHCQLTRADVKHKPATVGKFCPEISARVHRLAKIREEVSRQA